MKKKPCPFCGGKRLFVSKSDCSWHEPAFAYSVGCAGADCHGHIFALGHDLFKTENEAIEAWNERAAADEIEKLRAENERLTNNARSDARLLAAYHKWCDMHGCAPSSSDLSKARAALGEKE